ncbi:MAG: hypothetical protein IT544_04430 [Rhodobacteraceae bacterium]|nr:hypothetical protein [Paracoccaceae bacterium]
MKFAVQLVRMRFFTSATLEACCVSFLARSFSLELGAGSRSTQHDLKAFDVNFA